MLKSRTRRIRFLARDQAQRLFAALRPRLVALIRAGAERPAPADGFLGGGYDEAAMLAFASDVITAFGFDW